MRKTTPAFLSFLLLALCLTSFNKLPAHAQEVAVGRGPKVIYENHHDLSLALSDLVAVYGQHPWPSVQEVEPLPGSGNPYSLPVAQRDAALQQRQGPPLTTTELLNFDGLTAFQGGGVPVPDTNGAVGGTQFVQTVNTAYEVFDKTTGASLLAPIRINVIFSGFGGACETGPNYSDPIVLFDKLANRWVVSFIGSADAFQTGLECIAISSNSDATGSYRRYSFSFGNNLGDYPKLGSWPDAYYLTFNKSSNTRAAIGAQACALDRTSMLAGDPATMQCFQANERVLYSFTGGGTDGAIPYGGLIRDAMGNLYGTTYSGGSSNVGTVFEIDPSGNETVLYSFRGGADGALPDAGLIQDAAGNFYGTTVLGGASTFNCFGSVPGCGTVFRLDSSGNETVLFTLTGGADGALPIGGLVQDAAGNLYGTARRGGAVPRAEQCLSSILQEA